ncbi:MAG: PQQ-dependent sugar dehydrogenase, partial [Verrucomicrobiota bacterium]
MKTLLPLPILSLLFGAFPATAEEAAIDFPKNVALEHQWPNLEFERPISIVRAPERSEDLLVLQNGKILILPGDQNASQAELFLDISERPLIANAFEEGLLNLSFHPKFTENGKIYIYYTIQDPKRSVVSEMSIAKDGDGFRADPMTERVLLEVRQPFWNHNSGNMIFGPDGYLYIALGDGGKRDDPNQLAQNLWVLNGKILRIDVDSEAGSLPYGIPEDNPFVGKEGAREEIWAYGLRNPWGLYFDKENRFWCADVGQNLYEEINIIEKGGNYGWSFREGMHEFVINPNKPVPHALFGEPDFVEPIFEYGRTVGLSITGGFIYEGGGLPDLAGKYIYGD